MNDNKIKSMIGFAIKAGKVIFGEENIKQDRYKVKLAICCKSFRDERYEGLKQRISPIIKINFELAQIMNKNAKIIGITDRQMAESIIKYANEQTAE